MIAKAGLSTILVLILVLATASPLAVGLSPRPMRAAPSPATRPAITAEVAIVLDDATRQIVYAKAPHRRVAPASLTKMITAMVAIERGRLTDVVEVDVDSGVLVAETASSVMGLMPGYELTLEQLLYGLLLPSGNDAAIAIAEHIAGDERSFVGLMNAKVREMGLKDTRFANAHGLDDVNHFSTAYDMAIIARTAMQDPTIAKIVGTRTTKVRVSEELVLELYNGNPLIGRYRGADGVKPGYTDEAQQAVAATAKRGNKRLYVVVIRSDDLARDSQRLFDYYFNFPVLISARTTVLFPLSH